MGEGETGSSDIPADEPAVPTDPEPYDPDFDEGAFDGPPDDQEQPLAQHIEEMFSRLLVVLAVMALASGVVFPFAEHIINFLWFSFLPGTISQCPAESTQAACPRIYHPLGLILARLKVATLAGFILALPVFVYESYLFMRPGLYPNERRYYLASVPTSLILAGVGLLFAYFLVLPAIFTYFLYYSESAVDFAALGLRQTFDLIVMMLGFFAVIFQIPLFIMLAIMMGVTSRRWLASRRLYFWAGFATIAFIFNPDPTGMAPFIVTATMIALFEGTLALLWWTGEGSLMPSLGQLERARPYAWGLAAVVGYVLSDAPAPGSYYDALPTVVTDLLVQYGLANYVSVLIGVVLLVLFEGTNLLLRRLRRAPRFRAVLRTIRIPYWLGAIAVGYFANRDPPLLHLVSAIELDAVVAGAIALGLVVLYELALAAARWRRPNR